MKPNERICKNCKYFNPDYNYCTGSGLHEIFEEDTCEYWEEEEEVRR